MKELMPEEIQKNWELFLNLIKDNIQSPRKEQLLSFYKKYEDRIILAPASAKDSYHSCFPGGYVYHVLSVVRCVELLNIAWQTMDVLPTYTHEELIFSAINHDLGKMGDEENDAYLPSKDEWRKKNLGEKYIHNEAIAFMEVPDRSIYLLNQYGIKLSYNETLAIKLHDGMYSESNKPYLMSYQPGAKPRTALIYILHHADMMSTRLEFEHQSHLFNKDLVNQKEKVILKTKEKSLATVAKNDKLSKMIKDL